MDLIMATKYEYNGETYKTLAFLRQAIWETERMAFGTPTSQEDWDALAEKEIEVEVEGEDGEKTKEKRKVGLAHPVTQIEYNPDDELTDEEKAAKKLRLAKLVRSATVAKITVEVDGMTFDGDEESQSRMSRTISSAVAQGADLSTTMRTWVLADNSIAEVSVLQLARALELAGDAQTEAWTKPYETAEETKEAVE